MRTSKFIAALPLGLAFIFFVFPFIHRFQLTAIEWTIYKPVLRTAILASSTTLLSLVFGVVIGWLLFCYRVSRAGSAWLLLPFCLGGATWAILFLPVISRLPGVANRETWSVLTVLVSINVLQCAPLIAFVSFQSFFKTNAERHIIVACSQMTAPEAAELVFWPDLARFALFVGAVVFCSTFGEYEKSMLYFRASSGTESSLTSHAVQDVYRRLQAASHGEALEHVFSTSAAIVTFSAAVMVMTIALSMPVCRAALRLSAHNPQLPRPSFDDGQSSTTAAHRWVAKGSCAVFILSCIWSATASDGLVIRDIVAVFFASLFATTIYTAYAFWFRLSDSRLWNAEETNARWMFAGGLLLIRLIPGTLLFYLIVSWTVSVESGISFVRWLGWFSAHLLYNATVILPFLVLMLLRVPNNELDLLRASSVSNWDVSVVSLFERFYRQLLVIFLFVFVLIWNGDAANSAMSSVFQSANLEILTQLHGRQYNLLRCVELALPTVTFAILAVSCLAAQEAPSPSIRIPSFAEPAIIPSQQ
jgi:hypothetical protein